MAHDTASRNDRFRCGDPVAPLFAAVSRRTALGAAALALLALLPPVRPAYADEAQGYLTVRGVAGIDEGAAFPSLADAFAAVASCVAEEQPAQGACASVIVHGLVRQACDEGAIAALELSYPVDGATCALVGSDASSGIVVGDPATGAALALSCPSGLLVVRGVSFSGAVGLSCRDGLTVDACSFDRAVTCSASGAVSVAGNAFSLFDGGCALSVDLLGAAGGLTFAGNQVVGATCGLRVACLAGEGAAPSLCMTSNAFGNASRNEGSPASSTVVRLAGGVWPAGSIVRDGNAVDGASCLFVLDGSFAAQYTGAEGSWTEAVADATLRTATIAALFSSLGAGTSALPEGIVGICVDDAYAGTEVAAQVDGAASLLLPAAAQPVQPAAAQVSLAYDANGATAGAAPETVVVASGSSVTVSNMGSLVNAGYMFEGWNTQADGTGVFYAAGQTACLQADVVLYAQWAPTGMVATMPSLSASDGSAPAAETPAEASAGADAR